MLERREDVLEFEGFLAGTRVPGSGIKASQTMCCLLLSVGLGRTYDKNSQPFLL